MLNEGLGVMIRQKKILKHPNKRVRGALGYGLINLIPTALLIAFTVWLYEIQLNIFFLPFLPILIGIEILIHIIYFLYFFCFFLKRKKEKRVGKLVIDETGIKDMVGKKEKTEISWENIDFIVKKKYAVTILSKQASYIIVESSLKDKIWMAVRKYNQEVILLDKGQKNDTKRKR